MNWFRGEIADAIVASKTRKAIFVVYIEGKDDKSLQITELISRQEIHTILGSDNFVAIKIEADSIPYHQFSEIYKQPPVPSIYFIGKTGAPLEIVTEAKDTESLKERLNLVLQKAGISTVAKKSDDLIKQEQSATLPPNVVCENGVCTIKKDDKPSTSKDIEPAEAESSTKPDLTPDEKVERAKQLLDKQREEKKKEEEEKERQKEIERRKMGQNVQQLKRWQDEQQLKNVLEERQKEKRENQAARDRVLAQIAQDKAERASKFSPPQSQSQPQISPQVSPRAVNSNVARIQFRMPDGRTATSDFTVNETLESVHIYIRTNLNLPFNNYTLSTTFPRREFTDNDRSQTLSDLGLVPSAVILILPISRGTVSTNTSSGGFTGLLWTLFLPIFTIFGYLRSFIFGSEQNSTNTDRNKRTAETSNDSSRPQTKMRRAGETTVIKRQGNVHRLSNKNDSDDENNTWNGNSTQQM